MEVLRLLLIMKMTTTTIAAAAAGKIKMYGISNKPPDTTMGMD
jgi:hypothetical protein